MSEQEYIERLKDEIKSKLKHSLDSPTDFNYLALQVKQVTGEDISSTTLKRFFGYIQTDSATRRSSLSILARYLGYPGWSDYVKGTAPSSEFLSTKVVMGNGVAEGDIVEVTWGEDRKVTFVALGNNRFAVVKSENSMLMDGDEMEVMMFVLNQPLQIKNVMRGGVNIGHYTAGLTGGLTMLRYIQV
ncbi:MAG: hypothetical protein ACI30R_03415 [Sodaliphilus sp.]